MKNIPELVARRITPEIQKKLTEASRKTLDFWFKDLELETWEAYVVSAILHETMPGKVVFEPEALG